jgi:hypothetical protein
MKMIGENTIDTSLKFHKEIITVSTKFASNQYVDITQTCEPRNFWLYYTFADHSGRAV